MREGAGLACHFPTGLSDAAKKWRRFAVSNSCEGCANVHALHRLSCAKDSRKGKQTSVVLVFKLGVGCTIVHDSGQFKAGRVSITPRTGLASSFIDYMPGRSSLVAWYYHNHQLQNCHS